MTHSYLVTGAAGFIGNRLCAKLMEEKAYVKAILRKPLDASKIDQISWHESLVYNLEDLLAENPSTVKKITRKILILS